MTIVIESNNVVGSVSVPDGGWGWIIVFASLMIHFIMDGITYSMGDVFLRPMMDRFHSNRGPVSTIFAILPAITLCTGPIATIFTNSYGCRKVTIIGSLIAALGFLASCFSTNIWIYYLTIGVIGGVGFGLIYLPAIVSVGVYFERKRSFAMGIAVCGSGLGTLAFPFVMPFVINSPFWLDFDGALLIEAATIFICVLFGVLMIPLPQEPSVIRRLQRKCRDETKRNKLKIEMNKIDEQTKELISSEEREIKVVESCCVVPGEEESSKLNLVEDFVESSIVVKRKDATYRGSLNNIRLYNDNPVEYHRQIISSPIEMSNEKSEKKSFFRQIGDQIDLNLLRDGSFALFAVSNFLTSLGFNVPYNFANDLAGDAKVQEDRRHWVIMSIGIGNCFGRVIIGFLADRSWVNRLFLYNTTLIIAGIATIAAPFCNEIVFTHMTYGGLFGFFSGGYVGLTSIIVVDLVGVDKLSDAFGVLLLFQGVAVALGTPIAGTMRDFFSNFSRPYFWPYFIFGGSIVLSGFILFSIPIIKRNKERREQPTKHQLDMGVLSYSKQNLDQPEEIKEISSK